MEGICVRELVVLIFTLPVVLTRLLLNRLQHNHSFSILQVTELVLDNCLCVNGEIEGLNDTFKKLEFLSMANVELSSLARLPSLNKLRKVSWY